MKKEVIAHADPKSPISEIFRTLRTNIQFINTNKNTKTLLVTSTFPGEGKSWIASNLAVTFAQTGKKVVLVDADMRKGRQYTIFNMSPTPGLSNCLSQIGITQKKKLSEEIIECIKKTEISNLYLMPSGSIPPNPSELLVSPKMMEVLEKLKQAFDIVIIDGTPCELVTDSVILSRMVDSTIIVTAHKVTKKDALDRVIKNIKNVGGVITGIVVNKMPITGKKYEKKYYYYGEHSSKEKLPKVTNERNIKRKKEKVKNEEKHIQKEESPIIKEETTEKKNETKTKKTTTTKPKTATTRRKKTTTTQPRTKKAVNQKELEKVAKERTYDILKQMNEYMEKENAKKEEKGESND